MLLYLVALGLNATEDAPLRLTRTISPAGVQGRFDHFAIDAKGQRVCVAVFGNDTLEVLDREADPQVRQVKTDHYSGLKGSPKSLLLLRDVALVWATVDSK